MKQTFKKSKVAILFWDWGIGGVQTRFNRVITDLAAKKEVDSIALLLKEEKNSRILPDDTKFTVDFFSRHQEGLPRLKGFFWIWNFYQLLRFQPTHIVAIQNRFAVLAIFTKWCFFFMGKKLRVVINQATFTTLYLRQYERWYWKYIVMAAYRFADSIIVPTLVMRHDLKKSFFIDDKKISVIPSWVNTVKVVKKNKIFDLIFVGRIDPEKRVEDFLNIFIEAKKQKNKIKGCIVGDGVELNKIKQKIKSKGLESMIIFEGFSNNVGNLLSKSKLLVLPSSNEGLPMVVLEANALGVPAVVAHFSGAEEVVVHDFTGYIISDNKTLFSVCRELLQNKKKLDFLSRNARSWVNKKFSNENATLFSSNVLGSK